MQIVGDHLTTAAVGQKSDLTSADLFARSAFNRYYYGTFLASRQLIRDTTGAIHLAHKAIPDYLRGSFQQTMRKQIEAQHRADILSNGSSSQLLSRLKTNVSGLAGLLTEAYSVRLLADYRPEVLVTVVQNTFRLGPSTLSTAAQWIQRAGIHCKNLRSIWVTLGN